MGQWELAWLSHIWGLPGEPAIPLQIQEDALKKVLKIEDTVASSLDHLDLVVQPFHKAAVGSHMKEIGNLIPPILKRSYEFIEASQLTFLDPLDPGPDFLLGLGFGDLLFKNSGEFQSKRIGLV